MFLGGGFCYTLRFADEKIKAQWLGFELMSVSFQTKQLVQVLWLLSLVEGGIRVTGGEEEKEEARGFRPADIFP